MTLETHSNLINIIVNDGRYKSICKRLTGKRTHLADDLYQETMLSLLEVNDNRLIEASKGEYLEVFIVGAINKIWNKRQRVKSYEDGKTSPLMELSNTFKTEDEINLSDSDGSDFWQGSFNYNPEIRHALNEVTKEYDPKADRVFEATKKILNEDCNSQVMDIRYMARVYNYSNNNIADIKDIKACSNARKFAASSGINYMAVYKTCCNYKDRLKTKLKHLLND